MNAADSGPWTAKKLSGSYAQPGWVVLWPDNSKGGVHMRRIDWNGQMTEVDARLVAGAYCMLAALRRIEAASDTPELQRIACRAAIEKATAR